MLWFANMLLKSNETPTTSQLLEANVYFYMLDSSIPYLMCSMNACHHGLTSVDWFIEEQEKNIVTIETASHNYYQSSRV